MCRSKHLGGRRCPSAVSSEKKTAYNAIRRERYHANKNAVTQSTGFSDPATRNSFPDVVINEDDLFSEETMDTYTGGECYRLANSVHRFGKDNGYNWKLVAIVPDVEGMHDEWVHMSVLTEEGELLDIDGYNKHDEPYDASTNAPWLKDRWEYDVQQMFSRRTGVKNYKEVYAVQPKMTVVKNDAEYERLTQGQGQGAYGDTDADNVAKRLIAWYEAEKAKKKSSVTV